MKNIKIKYRLLDYLPILVYKITTVILLINSFLLTQLKALWWGVKVGKNCNFYGSLLFFKSLGGNITIGDRCTFRSAFFSNTIGLKQKCFLSVGKGGEIYIGNDCGLSGTVISASKSIILGERVLCGANVTMTDNDRHPLKSQDRREGKITESKPIKIGNDVFIGMNSIILKGVEIGDNAVIAANSVVTKNIPSNMLFAGNPAKPIKKIQ